MEGYIETIGAYANASVGAGLIARLFISGLARKHRVFTAFLCYDLALTVSVLSLAKAGFRCDYRMLWLLSRPLDWFFYVAVVYALLRDVMMQHPGIWSISRKVLVGSFASSIAIACISAGFQANSAMLSGPINLAVTLEQACVTASLLLLLATLAYFLWFPVEVTRNVASMSSGLVVYFAVKAMLPLARNLWSPHSVRLVCTALIFVSTATCLLWVLLLSRSGESRTVRVGHSWDPQQQQSLIDKLEAINKTLTHSVRPS